MPPVLEEYDPEGYSIRNTTSEDEDDEDDPEVAVLDGERGEDVDTDAWARRTLVGVDGSCTNELRRVSLVSPRRQTIKIKQSLGSLYDS